VIKDLASRVMHGESIRSIALDFNDRGIEPVGAVGGWGRRYVECWYRRQDCGVCGSTTARMSRPGGRRTRQGRILDSRVTVSESSHSRSSSRAGSVCKIKTGTDTT
jgi:hypothetical protein